MNGIIITAPKELNHVAKGLSSVLSTPVREEQPKYYNFEELGIDSLISILALWNRKVTNMKSSSIPLEKRKTTIISAIRKVIKEKPDHLKFVSIAGYFKSKEKPKAKEIDVNLLKYNIGDEVLYDDGRYRCKWILGKVVKFNTKSLTIQLDSYRTIDDLNAIQNQTYGEHKLIWNHCFGEKKVVITDPTKIYSKQDCLDRKHLHYLQYFEEGRERCDYGN
jgi:hypothetical protein